MCFSHLFLDLKVGTTIICFTFFLQLDLKLLELQKFCHYWWWIRITTIKNCSCSWQWWTINTVLNKSFLRIDFVVSDCSHRMLMLVKSFSRKALLLAYCWNWTNATYFILAVALWPSEVFYFLVKMLFLEKTALSETW